jgi:hypothetical protein
MKKTIEILVLAAVSLGLGCSTPTPTSSTGVQVIVANPYSGLAIASEAISGSSSGFYLQPYPGTSLSSVVLWMTGVTSSYNFGLSATDSSNGHSIGSATTGTVSVTGGAYTPVTFTFNGNPGVTKGDKVSFTVTCSSGPSGPGFCPQGSTSGGINIVPTTGGNPNSYGGVAIIVAGNVQ